ncbi:amino acid ABC transporter substrate-binding protein/permease [Vagococcus salmoninarum]|uniref:Glutamine ABC transporter permease n=1 Tax=Vagococcus salmoninarum TaxID=2739 RepID=A0A429ZMK9_9ENTE|nr:amino acid ABC transporter substrate-binding protein/permease [Vagococcus salmoninarum]RST94935.1 glutamine ABC transporter permease [Vagococcus salmoninarum]
MKKKQLIMQLVTALVLLLTLVLGSSTAQAEKKTTYVIGTDITFAPFEFSDSDGNYIGIDMDLLARIAEIGDVTFDIKPVGFSSAVQAVEAGQMDGVMAGMTITEERQKSFDFSDPYFQSGIQMAVASDNQDISGYHDLTGKTVAAKTGTESSEFLEAHKDEYGYTIKLYDTADIMYSVLSAGNVDAIFDDFPVIGYAVKQGQPLKLIGEFEKGGSYGFGVKKSQNPELLALFNAGLAELKASGEYDEILNTYIEAPEVTTDEQSFKGIILNNYQSLLKGLGYTLLITFASFIIATIIGILFGLMSVSEIGLLRGIASLYVTIIRGIPLYVFALFIYLGISNFAGIKMDPVIAGIITLSLNAGAYIAEIVRGGINAVPAGQTEAARSLGLPYSKTMAKIILPQAFKIMIPSFINQFVITLKDTSILSAIGILELLRSGQIIMARNLQAFKVLLIISIMYLVVITLLTSLSKRIERKVHRNGN